MAYQYIPSLHIYRVSEGYLARTGKEDKEDVVLDKLNFWGNQDKEFWCIHFRIRTVLLMGPEICWSLWFLTPCIHPHARHGFASHLERTRWHPKAPFFLDSMWEGTASVGSVTLLLYAFFADWIFISWHFFFRYFCLFKQDTVQSC